MSDTGGFVGHELQVETVVGEEWGDYIGTGGDVLVIILREHKEQSPIVQLVVDITTEVLSHDGIYSFNLAVHLGWNVMLNLAWILRL